MFKKKDKKEIFNDEIVIGKLKKKTKKRQKTKIKNEYFIDSSETVKDKDIQSRVEQMLSSLENFNDETEEILANEHPEPKSFPFSRDEVFGINKSEIDVDEDIINDYKPKRTGVKALSKFFEADKKKSKKLYNKDEKPKKRRRKNKDKEIDFTDAKEENRYRFGKRKFVHVDHFVSFLTQNYLEIEDIAKLVLKDEKFHGWISKRSGKYPYAFKEFKDIKTKIEK
jgi:hypothetical protein